MNELRTLVMVFLRPLEKWVEEGMNGLGIPAGMCWKTSVGGGSRLSACGVTGTASALDRRRPCFGADGIDCWLTTRNS